MKRKMRVGSKRWHQARRRRRRVSRARYAGTGYKDRNWYNELSYFCTLCHAELDWENCYVCAGDGSFDGYEDDPLFYSPGEEVPCYECNGKGGAWWCPTKGCPTGPVRKIFKIKPLLK